MKHKEGCPWETGFYKKLISRDSGGPDEALEISEEGVFYDYNEWTSDPDKDERIDFKFCPMCGISYEEN